MLRTRIWSLSLCAGALLACGGGDSGAEAGPAPGPRATPAEVGKLLFEDTRLSANDNQACASCHDAAHGFADPDATVARPVSEGSHPNSFGNRNAPTAAYAGFSPKLGTTKDSAGNDVYVGGQFLDGRRNTLEEQAQDPFLNPVEMANTSKQAVVDKVKSGPYVDKFKDVFGPDVFDNTDTAYTSIASAIAAFERSVEMNKFNSKFDCYLEGKYTFTADEKNGFDKFKGSSKCSICHSVEPDPVSGKVLLTNHQHFNIGVPKNASNPDESIDYGLGGFLKISAENGKFKTPTLRNIELTAPYMHNGVFATLEDVVRFYYILEKNGSDNTPEVSTNIHADATPVDDLSDAHVVELVAFMKTLTDGSGIGVCY